MISLLVEICPALACWLQSLTTKINSRSCAIVGLLLKTDGTGMLCRIKRCHFDFVLRTSKSNWLNTNRAALLTLTG